MKGHTARRLATAAAVLLLPLAAFSQPRAKGQRDPRPPRELAERAGLDAQTREALLKAQQHVREKLDQISEKLEKARGELEKVLSADEINEDAAMHIANQIAELQAALLKTRIQTRIALAKRLGPEKARILARIGRRFRAERPGFARRGEGRPGFGSPPLKPERSRERIQERLRERKPAEAWRGRRPFKGRPFGPPWMALRGQRRGFGAYREGPPAWQRGARRPFAERGRAMRPGGPGWGRFGPPGGPPWGPRRPARPELGPPEAKEHHPGPPAMLHRPERERPRPEQPQVRREREERGRPHPESREEERGEIRRGPEARSERERPRPERPQVRREREERGRPHPESREEERGEQEHPKKHRSEKEVKPLKVKKAKV